METVTEPAAKSVEVPPPTGWKAVWKHLQNWQEIYLFLPLALLAIWGFAQGAYFLTGRRPQENVDWIVGVAGNLVKCVFLIVLVSMWRQQTGIWLTKDEQMDNQSLAWAQRVETIVVICVFAYILQH